MADTKEDQSVQGVQARGAFRGKNQTLTLIGVVTGHVPVHLYGQGFLLILPYLSSTLGLATIQAGLIEDDPAGRRRCRQHWRRRRHRQVPAPAGSLPGS